MAQVVIPSFRSPSIPKAAAPRGLVLTPASAQTLVAGNVHLAFSDWNSGGGPMSFPIGGANEPGTVLTGMGPDLTGVSAAVAIEYNILASVLVALINIATNDVTTSPNDTGSPKGQRFADTYTIAANTASFFLAAEQDGEIKWFQVAT